MVTTSGPKPAEPSAELVKPKATESPDPTYTIDLRDLTPIQAAEMINAQLSRRTEIMTKLHQVRGNEFVQRVIGALTTPGVHAEDPILASFLVKRVESGKEQLRIAGTPAFKARISQELLRIAATNTGRVALEELLVGPQLMTIQYVRHDDFQSSGTVNVDPGYRLVLLGPGSQPITSTFATILTHELLHAVHDIRQELDFGKPVRAPDYDNREEENTVAGAPGTEGPRRPSPMKPMPTIQWSTPIQPTENSFRKETGQAERFGHHGREGDNSDRGPILVRFEQLETFALDGTVDAGAPRTFDEIDRICDAMANCRDQFEVTIEQITEVRRLAIPAMQAYLKRKGTKADLVARVAACYQRVNAALAEARAADPTVESLLESLGYECTLSPPVDVFADWQKSAWLLGEYASYFTMHSALREALRACKAEVERAPTY